MSRIYFHTKDETTAIGGSDRALMGHICKSMTTGMLNAKSFTTNEIDWICALLPPDHYLRSTRSGNEWSQRFETFISVSENLGGLPIFELQLNTAILFGSDAVKLSARIHGQCEVHGWFSTENKDWLCSIIQQGIKAGMFRDPDWQKVQHLAQNTKSDRIVMSYSVCDSFPDGDEWEEAISELSQDLEIAPQNLNEMFGDSVTAFSFRDWLSSQTQS